MSNVWTYACKKLTDAFLIQCSSLSRRNDCTSVDGTNNDHSKPEFRHISATIDSLCKQITPTNSQPGSLGIVVWNFFINWQKINPKTNNVVLPIILQHSFTIYSVILKTDKHQQTTDMTYLESTASHVTKLVFTVPQQQISCKILHSSMPWYFGLMYLSASEGSTCVVMLQTLS